MQIFLDSADPAQVRTAFSTGLVDGITTNPSLLAGVAKVSGQDFSTIVAKLLAAMDKEAVISLEVTTTKYDEMITQAKKLAAIDERVVVKVPATADGLKAARTLSAQGILVNVTLVFSLAQALLAAKAGAYFVSPFVGRLEDQEEDSGLELVDGIVDVYDQYGFETKVLFASTRSVKHVEDAALLGVDAITMPEHVFLELAQHKLTEVGLEKFLADWKSSGLSI